MLGGFRLLPQGHSVTDTEEPARYRTELRPHSLPTSVVGDTCESVCHGGSPLPQPPSSVLPWADCWP